MTATMLRRWSYRASAAFALGYAGYVLALKFVVRSSTGGPLGEVGEFLLVLAAVALWCVGLFADEALRRPRGANHPLPPAPEPPSAPGAFSASP